MKILFCTYSFSDYGLDNLYDGLCQLLGYENVIEYPDKSMLHGVKDNRYAWYPQFFDYPRVMKDEQKIEMLKNNEFDIILVGCRDKTDFTDKRSYKKIAGYKQILSLLREKSKTIPIYLIDQSDAIKVNYGLIRDLNSRLYFKREYVECNNDKIVPFSFSYSEKKIPNIDTERLNDIFWAGTRKFGNSQRHLFLDPLEKRRGKLFFNGWKQHKYCTKLLSYQICLNLKGQGDDTVRYYEIPAHGALLFSQKLDIIIDNEFIDGKTAVFFSSPTEMMEKLQYCLNNKDYTDRIRLAGHEHFKKYHTSKIRAEQLLNRIND
jgi:hypothetical protein